MGGTNNQIRSIRDAVNLFLNETGLALDFELMKVDDGVSAAVLRDNGGGLYGNMVLVCGEDGVMQACMYRGKHPRRKEYGPIVLDLQRYNGTYERKDTNPTAFLGVEAAESAMDVSEAARYL